MLIGIYRIKINYLLLNINIIVMKKITLLLVILVLSSGMVYSAPRAKIVNHATNPEMVTKNAALIPDSCVASGLVSVGKGQYVYLSVFNFSDTTVITNQTWTFVSKPTGSNATLVSIPSLGWWKFRTDSTGTYEIKVSMTTSGGTKDTTKKIYASNFVGVGNYAGVPAAYPNCMTCHSGTPVFADIFNRWKSSGHATMFKRSIDSGAAYYTTACMKCHTTGMDHNLVNNNNGFDDVARNVGWTWTPPPAPGKWDNLVTNYPALSQFATIGCENCHGAGSSHALGGGDTSKIEISYDAGMCGNCHGEPWRHSKFQQWENSLHSESVFEGRVVADSLRNSYSDCNRCHDGQSYVDYTKSRKGPLNLTKADQKMLVCQTCHDPHGNNNQYQLRTTPPGQEILANGTNYSFTGTGKTCLNCHKARRDNSVYITARGSFSSTWGPHESTQGDVLLGSNAATFGFPYITGSHKNIDNACVTCHMAETTDTGTVTRDKVGGHSMNLHDADSDYDYTAGCQSCHAGVTSFEDFLAPQDFDGNGTAESWEKEVSGCLTNLRIALPPAGVDSVAWQLIARDSNNVNLRKAYWNYLMIGNDGSKGMHNPFYTIQVLLTSKNYTVGIKQISNEIPEVFEMSQNYPNPFNPTTKIDLRIPNTAPVSVKIYDIMGREVKTLVNNQVMLAGKYTVDWNSLDNNGANVSTGAYFYRIVSGNSVITKKMMLIK